MKDLKVIFMGTPDFAVSVLQKLIQNTTVVLVVTQPDKYVGRKHILTPSPVKVEALKNNIKVFQPEKIRQNYDQILNTKADIIITCAYGQIIPKEILTYPKLGCINVHASLLPKYRGGAPIHWCLINGEEKTGITIMYMDEGMDTGDIIKSAEYFIKDEDNVGTLHDKLSQIGAQLLIEVLPSIINGTNKREKQDNEKATYAYNIKREEERIDFSKDGKSIINKIRGLNPWPLANFLINNEEMKVYNATFKPQKIDSVSKVVVADKKSLGISCKDGIIYLNKVKPYGKKEMNITDYLNGIEKDKILNCKVNG